MPTTVARRNNLGRLGARANGWARGAAGVARVVQSAMKVAKKVRTSKSGVKRSKKSATKPFRGTSVASVEPQTISNARLVINLGKPSKMKSLGRWIYVQQNNGRVTAGQGQQGAQAILGHNTISQLMTDTAVPNGLQFKDDIFAMNPYAANTGSGIFSQVAAPNQDIIHCRTVRTKFMMTNASSAPAVVVLYWVLSKKAHQGTPFDRWTSYLNDTALGQSAATQPVQSDSALGPGAVGVPSFAVYGQEPVAVKAWRDNFKVVARREYHMGFGACQKVDYTVAMNKTYQRTIASQHNSLGSNGYPGKTLWLCMVVRGTPVDISLITTGADTASVTTSNNEITWVGSVEYTYTGTPATRLDVNRVLQGFPSSGANVETEIMGPNAVPVDVVNT